MMYARVDESTSQQSPPQRPQPWQACIVTASSLLLYFIAALTCRLGNVPPGLIY